MYARCIWKFLVNTVLLLLSGFQAESAIDWFGHPDPSPHTMRENKIEIQNEVFLFKTGQVKSEGAVFAFSAEIQTPIRFTFQIYRPTNETNVFKFLAEVPVVPTVNEKQREDFYLESFLQNHSCVHVMPGDRLAVHFTSNTAPVTFGYAYEFDPQKPDHVQKAKSSNTPPKVGDLRTFDNTDLPVTFLATGYVHVVDTSNGTLNSTEVKCRKGVTIPRSPVTVITTTYVPPTGVPGMTGATGSKGPTGVTGPLGLMGTNGTQRGNDGAKGQPGKTGPIGLMGVNSTVIGSVGINGSDGMVGPTGDTGATGQQGKGGHVGPMGTPGENYILGINIGSVLSPTDEGWWQSNDSMEAVYIWLAIASFAVLVSLVLLIIDCCLYSSANQYLTDSPNS